ncbi:MAG: aldo/keto reductase [candidate division Zixibacteria bacterium]|nr:aldo/keto reductase [candidate division Zixibacteria bacterium]
MGAIPVRRIGKTEAEVTVLGFGGAPLGDLFELVPETQAQDTLQAAWDSGIRYYDTSPFYGHGKSEHRIGYFMRQQPHGEYVISTKVGRIFKAVRNAETFKSNLWAGALPFDFYYDYSYDGVMRSYEDSLTRMSVNDIELLLIHDLDHFFHTEPQVQAYLNQMATSGWRALSELKSAGLIKAVGAGINKPGFLPRYLDMVPLDFFIVAMPYTLLDQAALDGEFQRCAQDGVTVVIGSPFASGILVTGPVEGARYGYVSATPEILEKTRRIQTVCQRHGVPLPTAAMHFALAHPVVSAIIPGAFKPEFIHTNVGYFNHPVPTDMWAELRHEKLIREYAPTPR